jgi:hypothetical protein
MAIGLVGLAFVVELARRITAPLALNSPLRPTGRPHGRPRTTARGRATGAADLSSAAGGRLTRQELYDEGRRLEITGRSAMSKAQLSRAATEAREGET